MANSKSAISKVIKEEAGFQAQKADAGNYFKGQLIGTKYGITPNAYFNFYRKEPTQDTIKNLTINEAIPIYKIKYWDKIRGDEILNSSVADLLMFVVVNSGVGMIKSIKNIINQTQGKNVIAVNNNPFTSAEIKILNALPQDIFFKNIKNWRELFYKALVQNKPQNSIYLKGWLNRLNKHVYSGVKSKSQPLLLIGVGLLLFSAGTFAGYKYVNL